MSTYTEEMIGLVNELAVAENDLLNAMERKRELLLQIEQLVKTNKMNVDDSGLFNSHIDVLGVSMRISNCLKVENIFYIGQLIQCSEVELFRTPNLGRKTVSEIKEKLAEKGLQLGTKLPDWNPPESE